MKTIIFLTIFLGIIFSAALAEAAISCSVCLTGFCNCTVTECPSGSLDVYTRSDCVGTPIYEYPFSNGAATWQPENTGTYYFIAFCQDKVTKSFCTKFIVSSSSALTTTTIPTTLKEIPYYYILIPILIIIMVLIFNKKRSWENLYEKWSGEPKTKR
jgi:hypothetical protein